MNHLTCSLIFIQILILGPSKGMEINITRNSISAIVGQSVLLETSYKLPRQMANYTIRWKFEDRFILYYNFPTDPEGLPIGNKGKTNIFNNYIRRVEYYLTNASLLLQNLQISDTGNYIVILSADGKIFRRNITVYVTNITSSCLTPVSSANGFATSNSTTPCETTTTNVIIFSLRTAFCFLPFAVLVFLLRRWECG